MRTDEIPPVGARPPVNRSGSIGAMTLSRAWVLPLTPVAAVLLIALALVPVRPGQPEAAWLLGFLVLDVALAAGVALAARQLVGKFPEPVHQRITLAIATGVLTLLVPFAVSLLLGGPSSPMLGFPWLVFGLAAACWQLYLCEGPRSRALHAVIGFGYTFCFAGLTLFFSLAASGLID
ncbi:hypothetical protein FKR81_23860 [Lentzea tibetensis]|uniref:Uncharacterized protein n=1 Tax=Lentzea tibetensis TaxID=2591470 RepID=A0A563EQ08_9PSEU|nr:hypothetical protein [Lentzea tibetensis]TWP49572.1 hypothetical protein FKR81_23860 [Lentzea tibetensis]